MGWGEKAIEIRSVETGHLDGVFMHKRAQRLKFLCERNDKVPRSRCVLRSGCCLGSAAFPRVLIDSYMNASAFWEWICRPVQSDPFPWLTTSCLLP